jgi:hypothetical protein
MTFRRSVLSRHSRFLAIAILSLPLLASCISAPPETDFSVATSPDQQVAIVSTDTVGFNSVDGVRNHLPFGSGWKNLTGDHERSIRIPPGLHTVEVSFWTGPHAMTLKHVRIQVAANHHYRFAEVDGQVTFAETYGGLVRNIPLHDEVLSAVPPGNAHTTVIINVVRPGLTPVPQPGMPASQPDGPPLSPAILRPAPAIATTRVAPDGAPLSRATLQPMSPDEPAMTYDQWLKAHPEAAKKADADSAN